MSSVSAHRRAHFRSILNLCSAACVLFLLAGRTFPRGGSLVHEPMGPRSVRAAVGASVVLLLWALAHLLSGVAPIRRS